MAENLPFLFLKNNPVNYKYQGRGGGGEANIPQRNRNQHANKLLQDLNTAVETLQNIKEIRAQDGLPNRKGNYFKFESKASFDLMTDQLERIDSDIRLLNVKETGVNKEETIVSATVYVPEDQEKFYRKKISDYKTKPRTKTGKYRNQPLINSIENISAADLESLWTDTLDLIPANVPKWCEVWLNINDFNIENLDEVKSVCDFIDITYREQTLSFPERKVLLISATRNQLNEFVQQSDNIAEIRLLKETARFWLIEKNVEQTEWIADLLNRAKFSDNDTGICLLDTGVNNGHLLLAPVIADADKLTINPLWGVNDHDGHGTLMSGALAYGNIQALLESNAKFEVTHKITSVKTLPPVGANDKDLYGAITNQAVSRAELQNPNRKQVYCMAITSDEKIVRGRPTSWSAAIDQLAFGEEIQADEENILTKRLIILSAGNIRNTDEYLNYPDSNLTISVEDPSQSWNALTVGAITNKVLITDPAYADHTPLAEYGQLSPYSSTSLTWERKWPLKPEIVLEGGNILRAPDDSIVGTTDDLAILSTSARPVNNQFDAFHGTSASTAHAAWMAAQVQNNYKIAWPETIRGLLVHSARWTDELINQFNIDTSKKTELTTLMRTCGYGVPDIEKALFCTKNSFTVIAEKRIKPFGISDDGKRVVARDMHFYQLPWPKDLLIGLGETNVTLRITLSYFIEPSPGELGWRNRYKYQSFGLRFDLNNSGETQADFLKRINLAQRQEDEVVNPQNDSGRWKIGSTLRNLGSIHSDTIETTAAEIATCNLIGIYPVTGWWKERKYLEHWNRETRYSLIVSLETPSQDIDIYTPVQALINIPIEIPIPNKKGNK